MIYHYFTLALRNLAKYKIQNIISILGLAVGILCFTICLYITRYTLSTDSCFSNKERITQICMEDTESNYKFAGTSSAMVEELRSMDIPQLENIVTLAYPNQMTFNITLSQHLVLPYTFHTIETDEEFLPIFTPEIISGSWENATAMPNSIVMSESAAIRIFGNVHDAIGKNMTLTHSIWSSPPTTPHNGGINYTIAAVMKDIPSNNSISFMNPLDILRLNDSEGVISYIKRNPRQISRTTGTTTYVLLREGFTKEDFTKWLADKNYTFKTIGKECRVNVESSGLNGGILMIAVITGIIGLLVLATSLLNFFNFLIASFYNKTKEYSLRKVYGGEFSHLFKQLYVHSSVIVLLASLLMLSIIEVLGDNAFKFSLDMLGVNFVMNKETMIQHALQYTAFLLVMCGIICLFITGRLHRLSVYSGVKQNIAANKVTGRNIMLWWQIFICWLFLGLVGGLLLQSNVSSSIMFPDLSKEMKSSIVSVDFNYTFEKESWKRAMIDRISQHSAVEDVLITDISLCEGMSSRSTIYWEGDDKNYKKWNEINIMVVPDNFFRFMNIPIGEGNLFSTENEVVADKRLQKNFGEEIIGKSFRMSITNQSYNVTGLCKNEYKHSIYEKDAMGFVFMKRAQNGYLEHCYLKSVPTEVKTVQKYVDSIMRANLPQSVDFRSTTLMEDIQSAQVIEYTLRKVIVFFAVVCILITILGVYSSISMDTDKRVREIAIMKVHGAAGRHIAWKFIKLYTVLLGTSAAIAFPLLYTIFHYWSTMYAQSFTAGPLFWTTLFLLMSLLVGITIYWKIAAIIKINPAEVIAQE